MKSIFLQSLLKAMNLKASSSKTNALFFLVFFMSVCSLQITAQENRKNIKYEQRVEHAYNKWMKIIPNLFLTQYAGNIGFLSTGIGWDYGKHDQWETHMLLGFIPHYVMADDMPTFTLRECYLPWTFECNDIFSISPLVASFSINTVFNSEFWFTESERYPGDYYRFSSKLRAQIGIGSRINLNLSKNKQTELDRLSFYYEISTYDLALISYVPNLSSFRLSDILALGIGFQYKFF